MTDAQLIAALEHAFPHLSGAPTPEWMTEVWTPTGHDRIVLMREGQTFETLHEERESGRRLWRPVTFVTYPDWICLPCGNRYGRWQDGRVVSVRHGDRCGWCGATDAPVTRPADFGMPAAPGSVG